MKVKRLCIVTLISTLAILLLNFFGVFSYLELKTYDFRIVNSTKFFETNENLFVILLDQESLDWAKQEKSWSWPWPRQAYADIIDFLNLGKASSITFDVVFSEPSVYGKADDEVFAKASRDYGHVVQVQYIDSNNQLDPNVQPIPELLASAKQIGNINSLPDTDSVIRRSRLYFKNGNSLIPTLGVASLLASEKQLPFIKTDKDNSVLLRFKKGLESYCPYSAKDILQSYYNLQNGAEPLLLPSDFADANVFFGFYAAGLFDICSTPLSSSYPGVGIHLTLLDNILNNEFIHESPFYITILLVLLFSFLGSVILEISDKQKITRNTILVNIILFTIFLLTYLLLCYWFFINNIWLPIISVLIAYSVSFLISIFLSYNSEGKQKRYLKSAFNQYLSPVVIDQLISHPETLKLGGERKEISMYFSDVQGFTSISEKLSPEKLTDLLNTYLSAMSEIILKHGGTIDKYEGDAIIAFWNAPLQQENHSKQAIDAAIECQKELENMSEILQAKAGTKLKQRIGLNTGYAVVGNMGSYKRFDYTMLGDAVNLASRLEGINKIFGTYTLCTKNAMDKAIEQGSDSVFVEIAKVIVLGKSEPVQIFLPMTNKQFKNKEHIYKTFSKGLKLFYLGKLDQAKTNFDSISKKFPPAAAYSNKCIELENSVTKSWTGIWVASEK